MPGVHMHDILAVSVAMDQTKVNIIPDNFRRETFIFVETEGKLTSGMTIADLRQPRNPRYPNADKPNGHVCVQVNVDKFFELFNKNVLFSLKEATK
jgi:inosine-uridine nucleoside N-ribohydrolase